MKRTVQIQACEALDGPRLRSAEREVRQFNLLLSNRVDVCVRQKRESIELTLTYYIGDATREINLLLKRDTARTVWSCLVNVLQPRRGD